MAEHGYNDCKNCGGDGNDGSGFCYPCLGTGSVSTMGLHLFLKDFSDRVDAIKTVVDAILIQVS